MSTPLAAALAASVLVVVLAAVLRNGQYATFTGVLLGICVAVFAGLEDHLGPLLPAALALHAAALVHFLSLVRPRLRGWPWRVLITWPGHFWVAATFLAFPWAIVAALGFTPHGWWLPYLVSLGGLAQSLGSRMELVELTLDGRDAGADVERCRDARRLPIDDASEHPRALRIVQITDPHLGPFMSEARLAGICARAVAQSPDLIFLTGDFFTMEGSGTPQSLARALAPLKAMQGRVFACRGNHDLEVPDIVAHDLAAVGARLLIDEAENVETAVGLMQVLGLDHVWRNREAHYPAVFAQHPRGDSVFRIVLLHDPGGFHRLPAGEADLVLAGHTHGGHLGLVSFGLDWTTIGGLSGIPDHGLWRRGRDRMYVHRANGHYGFPLRIGVPSEESVLRLVLPHTASTDPGPMG